MDASTLGWAEVIPVSAPNSPVHNTNPILPIKLLSFFIQFSFYNSSAGSSCFGRGYSNPGHHGLACDRAAVLGAPNSWGTGGKFCRDGLMDGRENPT